MRVLPVFCLPGQRNDLMQDYRRGFKLQIQLADKLMWKALPVHMQGRSICEYRQRGNDRQDD